MVLALAGILTGCTANFNSDSAAPAASATAGVLAASQAPVAAPTPAVIAAADNPWNPATCDWAAQYLTEDARLDRQAAAAGSDPRFPNNTPATMLAGAAQWDAIGQLVAFDCGRAGGTPGQGGMTDCSTAFSWAEQAAVGHEVDLQRVGITASDASWDQAWAAFYRTLAADLKVNCGVG